MKKSAVVLIVDDKAANRRALHQLVVGMGHQPVEADTVDRAKQLLDDGPPDLVLLDLELPDTTRRGGPTPHLVGGQELLLFIKSQPQNFPFLPVIVVSVEWDTATIVKCLQHGADDYVINAPYEPEILRARIENALLRYRLMRDLQLERDTIGKILRSILPDKIAKVVIEHGTLAPQRRPKVAVLFCDIHGFTAASQAQRPREIFDGLNQLFTEFEGLARRHQVEKIKTIGDAFMAAAGLLEDVPDPVARCVEFGRAIIMAAKTMGRVVRVGVHCGPVFAGFIGTERYVYDLLGHTVNLASRIEGIAKPNGVCLSADAYEEVKGKYPDIPPEYVEFKNVTNKEAVHHIWRSTL